MKNKIRLITIILVILLFIILAFLVKDTYSSFASKIIGESKTVIGEPVFVLEHTEKKVLDDSNYEVNYYFTVKNYDANKVNDVNLKYMIEITPKQDKAIILSLYKDNQLITLNEQKTSYISLGHTNKEKHEYRLNVKYDKNSLENSYDINSNICIKANAVQN